MEEITILNKFSILSKSWKLKVKLPLRNLLKNGKSKISIFVHK
jgi:hypothetical protein